MNIYIVADDDGVHMFGTAAALLTYIPAAETSDVETYQTVYIPPSTYVSKTTYSMSEDYTFELSSVVDPPPYSTWTFYVDAESLSYSSSSSDIPSEDPIDMSAIYYGMTNV